MEVYRFPIVIFLMTMGFLVGAIKFKDSQRSGLCWIGWLACIVIQALGVLTK